MKRAMGELVRRHEILRTAFSQADGELMQVVSPEVNLALQEVDLESLGEAEGVRERARVVREEGRKPLESLPRAPASRDRDSLLARGPRGAPDNPPHRPRTSGAWN